MWSLQSAENMALDTKFVRGADKLQARIATIRQNLQLPILIEEVGQLLLRRTLDRFENEVDPDGKSWVPLKETTLRRKAYAGYGSKKKLQRTGKLKSSIRVIRGGSGTTFTNTGAGLRIGIENPEVAVYGKIQNTGNNRIRARRFLGIGALDVKAVDSLLRRKAKELGGV
jgi:phage gpG-like protein